MTDNMTMKLNHLSFPSNDYIATAEFFEKHLGCTIATRRESACILKRPGFDIVIENAAALAMEWPRNFHIGFEMPSVETVRDLHDRFEAEGVEIETAFFKHERGSRFFCKRPVA
jgi:catechol 2,3-dioxygenase-like lactoylglutathione lyase family enzyme